VVRGERVRQVHILDAVSWVLGEQSAKILRGTHMQDVIFAGTRERKALGMAEVTLTMVDRRITRVRCPWSRCDDGAGRPVDWGRGRTARQRAAKPRRLSPASNPASCSNRSR